MPSIHAILLVALGGILSADPRDDSAQDRSAIEDPFSAQADYGAPAPRQPRGAAGGSSPGTVRLPSAPLPGDSGLTDRREASAMGAAGVDSGDTDAPGSSTTAAVPRWESGPAVPPERAPTPRQAANLQTSAVPPSSGHDTSRPIPLAPPSGSGDGLPHVLPTMAWPVVVGSLGGVIGLFLIVAWVLRRGAPHAVGGLLPREVVEVLGRAPLADRKQMQLLRLGNKLVLIAVSPTGADALAEITDPVEVDRLTGYCYQGHPNSSTVAFHKVFKSFETAPKRKAARGSQRVGYADLDQLGFDDSPGESDHVR